MRLFNRNKDKKNKEPRWFKRKKKSTILRTPDVDVYTFTQDKISLDNKKRGAIFDLNDPYWLDHPEEFFDKFEHTNQIKVPEKLEDWLIGQEHVKLEMEGQFEEWVRKLIYLDEIRSKGVDCVACSGSGIHDDNKNLCLTCYGKGKIKPKLASILKEMPGPDNLLIGKPGTGKSLLIKILSEKLEKIYKENNIKLYDVLLVNNPTNRKKPKVRYVPAGLGREIVSTGSGQVLLTNLKNKLIKNFMWLLFYFGILLLSTAIVLLYIFGFASLFSSGSEIFYGFLIGGSLLMIFPLFILYGGFGMSMQEGGRFQSQGWDEVPSLIVDNGPGRKLYVDATSSNSANLLGGFEHDPYQSGNLGTPSHHRASAGAIHQAHRKILFIDEIRNLPYHTASELLTAIENGSFPIKGRAWSGSEGNQSLAAETEEPVDCLFFLLAAGNEDTLFYPESALVKLPPLRDRFYYGNITYMDDEMDDTLQNRIKWIQMFTDEIYRFNFPPMTKAGCERILHHMRRKASSNNQLRIQGRYIIQIIKKSAQLFWLSGKDSKEDYIDYDEVEKAITKHTKEIEEQMLEREIKKSKHYKLIERTGSKLGRVNGLVVFKVGEYGKGGVESISSFIKKVNDSERADYIVTGINEAENTWITDSKRHVRTAIYKLYNIDIAKDYYVNISFVGSNKTDGPSAGITMTLALMSLLGDPNLPEDKRIPIPLKQNVAVTGTIEIIGDDKSNDFKVGPVGGIYEKIAAANEENLNLVIIPKENYNHSIDQEYLKYYNCDIIGCSTIQEYFKMLRDD